MMQNSTQRKSKEYQEIQTDSKQEQNIKGAKRLLDEQKKAQT